MDVVDVNDLTCFEKKRKVLDQLNLKLQSGNIYALVGHNGAGKAKLLRSLSGTQTIAAGTITLFGDTRFTPEYSTIHPDISLISSSNQLPNWLTVNDVDTFYARSHPNWSQNAYRQSITQLNLSPSERISDLYPSEKIMLSLLTEINKSSRLILIEEFIQNLDSAARAIIFRSILEKRKHNPEITVVFTSNHTRDIEQYASHLLLMKNDHTMVNTPLKAFQDQYQLWCTQIDNKHLELPHQTALSYSLHGNKLEVLAEKGDSTIKAFIEKLQRPTTIKSPVKLERIIDAYIQKSYAAIAHD